MRIEPELWKKFDDAVTGLNRDRSEVIRDFIDWFVNQPSRVTYRRPEPSPKPRTVTYRRTAPRRAAQS